MTTYCQISYRERLRLYRGLLAGQSVGQLAQELGRHRSTINREIPRNGSGMLGYLPDLAARRARRRRRQGRSKIIFDADLRLYVEDALLRGWSPEQIAGRMRHQDRRFHACHETIYRYMDYISYVGPEHCIHPPKHAEGHIPARAYEPLAFIKTDAAFIRGHNDVFNDNVAAYLAAIATEGQFKQAAATGDAASLALPNACPASGRFQFGTCFQAYHRDYCGTKSRNPPNETCAVTPNEG